jgi:hypothetical protein
MLSATLTATGRANHKYALYGFPASNRIVFRVFLGPIIALGCTWLHIPAHLVETLLILQRASAASNTPAVPGVARRGDGPPTTRSSRIKSPDNADSFTAGIKDLPPQTGLETPQLPADYALDWVHSSHRFDRLILNQVAAAG